MLKYGKIDSLTLFVHSKLIKFYNQETSLVYHGFGISDRFSGIVTYQGVDGKYYVHMTFQNSIINSIKDRNRPRTCTSQSLLKVGQYIGVCLNKS